MTGLIDTLSYLIAIKPTIRPFMKLCTTIWRGWRPISQYQLSFESYAAIG